MRGVSLWQPFASLLFAAPACSCEGCVDGGDGPHGSMPVKWIETRPNPVPSTMLGDRIVVHAAKKAMRLPDVRERRRAVEALSLGPKFLGVPERWLDSPTYWCGLGHISTVVLRSESGDRCLACRGAVMMVPPEWAAGGDLAFGALLGTVKVAASVPMVAGDTADVEFPYLWLSGDGRAWLYLDAHGRDVSDQVPYGDFQPGRYAWLLQDAERFVHPVDHLGKQGVMIVDDSALPASVPVIATAAGKAVR